MILCILHFIIDSLILYSFCHKFGMCFEIIFQLLNKLYCSIFILGEWTTLFNFRILINNQCIKGEGKRWSNIIFFGTRFWDSSWPKRRDLWPNFWEGSELPMRIFLAGCPRPILAQRIPNCETRSNHANECSICNYWCLRYEDIFFLKLDKKRLTYGPKALPKYELNCQIS